ncbi:MAG: Ig-like domain-containing protein, partial [Muribaculaceae bacterium]|nr:Ig-like domain-containing protein [Muribaculaceae bacterium]
SSTVKVNGEVLPKAETGYEYVWMGKDESISMVLPDVPESLGIRYYIKALKLEYSILDPNKKSADLSFNESICKAIIGSEENVYPTLSNHSNLPVEWTSSNPEIATINVSGVPEILKEGTTTIKARFIGNDEYNPDEASYTLTVINVAKNIADMLSYAPMPGNEVLVNFPMTISYCAGGALYVIDDANGATQITSDKTLQVGDVIPAGWMATNNSPANTVSYKGDFPEVTGNVEEVKYPFVQYLVPSDNNRVVTLINATFTVDTPKKTSYVDIAGADGSTIRVRNPNNLPVMPKGTYDIFGIAKSYVSLNKNYFEIAVIEYLPATGEAADQIYADNISLQNIVSTTTKETLQTPYSVTVGNSTVEFISHSAANSANTTGFEIAKGGVYILKGNADFKVSCPGKKIAKIYITNSGNMAITAKNTPITTDGSANAVWYCPENYDKDYVEFTASPTISTRCMTRIQVFYMDDTTTPVTPEILEVSANYETINIEYTKEPDDLNFIVLSGEAPSISFEINFNVPEGYDGIIGGLVPQLDEDIEENPSDYISSAYSANSDVNSAEQKWEDKDQFINSGMSTETTWLLPTEVPVEGRVFLMKKDKVLVSHPFYVSGKVKNSLISSEEEILNAVIDSNDYDGYYTLDGIRIHTPAAPGIYIRVLNGKASKVTL